MSDLASLSRPPLATPAEAAKGLPRVILASSVGTMIEWYDFYIFGSLTAVLAPKFYPPGNDTFTVLAYLATFAVGFLVRPFGALFFGRIGDMAGRKVAFLITLTAMGGATAAIGLLPTYQTAGWFSPIALLLIRVLQGLALGGEYGGAAVYVAEHSPDNRRGFYTSFIQITATLGLFVSLLVILGTQMSMSKADFSEWGWRVPFLLSIVLVSISLYIRLKMKESPIFAHIKSTGKHSANPLKEAFTQRENLKRVAITLFGATAGQGVIWYTGQFYALFYLQSVLLVNKQTAFIDVAVALLLSMPFFTIFGALSDRIGRKKLMMAACLLAVVSYIPIYHGLRDAAGNHVDHTRSLKNKVTGEIKLTPMTAALDPVTQQPFPDSWVPAKEATHPNQPMIIFLVWLQVILVCMIYGPIAAYLVEAFPARIRYTAMSLPYHIGNGVFGGMLPLIGLSLCASTGNIFAGLYYPMAVAALTFLFGIFMLKESNHVKIWDEVVAD